MKTTNTKLSAEALEILWIEAELKRGKQLYGAFLALIILAFYLLLLPLFLIFFIIKRKSHEENE